MPFLDDIKDETEAQIAAEKRERSIGDLKRMIRDAPQINSFANALRNDFGLIAEVKRKSPSKGGMREENVEKAPAAYSKSPIVKAVSVLTNASRFGMSVDQLARIRPLVRKPILRKDFILKEYQVYAARAFGADAILLMANLLNQSQLRGFFGLAQELGMDVLFEVHEKSEIEKLPEAAKIVGVNSRKFMATRRWWFTKWSVKFGLFRSSKAPDPSVDMATFSLIQDLPRHVIKVAESGVGPNRVKAIAAKGYDAVLVGTSLLLSEKGVENALLEFEQKLSESSEAFSPSTVPATT